MSTLKQTLLRKISRRRKAGDSLRSIAIAGRIAYQSLYGFVNSDRDISLSTVEKLAKVLGLKFCEGE